MFRLGDQLASSTCDIGCLIDHNRDFTRSRKHIDTDIPVNHPLRGINVGIPRPDDLIHLGNGSRAIRHRSNGLRTTDCIDFIHTSDMRSGQCSIRWKTGFRLRRRTHNYPADTRNACRYSSHQHRTRIGRSPTRHVDSNACKRNNPLPEALAGNRVIQPRISPMRLVKSCNPVFRDKQSRFKG